MNTVTVKKAQPEKNEKKAEMKKQMRDFIFRLPVRVPDGAIAGDTNTAIAGNVATEIACTLTTQFSKLVVGDIELDTSVDESDYTQLRNEFRQDVTLAAEHTRQRSEFRRDADYAEYLRRISARWRQDDPGYAGYLAQEAANWQYAAGNPDTHYCIDDENCPGDHLLLHGSIDGSHDEDLLESRCYDRFEPGHEEQPAYGRQDCSAEDPEDE